MDVRRAEAVEVERLAKLWHDAWNDAHAALVPEEIKRVRTLESLRERMAAAISIVRVVGPVGQPLGFCMVKDDELDQLFVAAEARGTGVATALVADAEARIAASGHDVAWLTCAIGNDRAARFYEKCGWRRTGNIVVEIEKPDGGSLPHEAWRYEKRVR